ncbi:cyclic nucleotide-gated cation channel beta-1 [Reticulomyxa filosa]|uniref:Cyclic nucleotide-gated cation channel beta-1 n=1 Tax=Reticulomyxa filosa TaxID=46433 RepID=X6NEY9_RETFI|nr:cyclic nucleotide-gated cation channel beta-1 [Reticulomyxa filosa]|eukprot:ETO24566.1 cyclic nucleotide-gated cation channel beta-1 [Reticulomyxa filosa]
MAKKKNPPFQQKNNNNNKNKSLNNANGSSSLGNQEETKERQEAQGAPTDNKNVANGDDSTLVASATTPNSINSIEDNPNGDQAKKEEKGERGEPKVVNQYIAQNGNNDSTLTFTPPENQPPSVPVDTMNSPAQPLMHEGDNNSKPTIVNHSSSFDLLFYMHMLLHIFVKKKKKKDGGDLPNESKPNLAIVSSDGSNEVQSHTGKNDMSCQNSNTIPSEVSHDVAVNSPSNEIKQHVEDNKDTSAKQVQTFLFFIFFPPLQIIEKGAQKKKKKSGVCVEVEETKRESVQLLTEGQTPSGDTSDTLSLNVPVTLQSSQKQSETEEVKDEKERERGGEEEEEQGQNTQPQLQAEADTSPEQDKSSQSLSAGSEPVKENSTEEQAQTSEVSILVAKPEEDKEHTNSSEACQTNTPIQGLPNLEKKEEEEVKEKEEGVEEEKVKEKKEEEEKEAVSNLDTSISDKALGTLQENGASSGHDGKVDDITSSTLNCGEEPLPSNSSDLEKNAVDPSITKNIHSDNEKEEKKTLEATEGSGL